MAETGGGAGAKGINSAAISPGMGLPSIRAGKLFPKTGSPTGYVYGEYQENVGWQPPANPYAGERVPSPEQVEAFMKNQEALGRAASPNNLLGLRVFNETPKAKNRGLSLAGFAGVNEAVEQEDPIVAARRRLRQAMAAENSKKRMQNNRNPVLGGEPATRTLRAGLGRLAPGGGGGGGGGAPFLFLGERPEEEEFNEAWGRKAAVNRGEAVRRSTSRLRKQMGGRRSAVRRASRKNRFSKSARLSAARRATSGKRGSRKGNKTRYLYRQRKH